MCGVDNMQIKIKQPHIQIKCIQTSETNKFTSDLSSGNSSYRQAVYATNGRAVRSIMPMVTCDVVYNYKTRFREFKYTI